MRLLFLILSCGLFLIGKSQVKLYPTGQNTALIQHHQDHPNYQWKPQYKQKWGRNDTLKLPFFEDFSTTTLYPDSMKWFENQVYVNNHFGFFPPTMGVATFDHLDPYGVPYGDGLNSLSFGSGDTLTSLPIRTDFIDGVPLNIADSLVLSFFYQPNGFGYQVSTRDSFIVEFKNIDSNWVKVWAVNGKEGVNPFQQVFISLNDIAYFHPGFQFRFRQLTRRSGNSNQWQLDYILLDRGRSITEQKHHDFAIQTIPTRLTKNYYAMPYKHFIANYSNEVADQIYFHASNLYDNTCNCEVKQSATNKGNILVNTDFSANANNINPFSNALRQFAPFDLSNLQSENGRYVVDRTTFIREANGQGINPENDVINHQQVFHDFFAYDDGSAEMGFGFDNDINPVNIPGQIAYRFKLNQEDTLVAVRIFFNIAVKDVSQQRFRFKIWKEIKGLNGGTQDDVLYESPELVPQYQGGSIGWYNLELPEEIILSQGDFYVGWSQNRMFNLNVGWDRNNGNQLNTEAANGNIFYELFDNWASVTLPGALMIRPYFGASKSYANIPKITAAHPEITLYPNPAQIQLNIDGDYVHLTILNAIGQVVLDHPTFQKTLDIRHLKNGIYFVQVLNKLGVTSVHKIVVSK